MYSGKTGMDSHKISVKRLMCLAHISTYRLTEILAVWLWKEVISFRMQVKCLWRIFRCKEAHTNPKQRSVMQDDNCTATLKTVFFIVCWQGPYQSQAVLLFSFWKNTITLYTMYVFNVCKRQQVTILSILDQPTSFTNCSSPFPLLGVLDLRKKTQLLRTNLKLEIGST